MPPVQVAVCWSPLVVAGTGTGDGDSWLPFMVVVTGEGDSVGGDVGEADGEGGAMVGHMSAAQAVLQAVKATLLFQASAIVFFVQLVIAFAPAKALVIMPTTLMSH